MPHKQKDIVSENVIEFSDNRIVQELVGFHNESLKSLESKLGIKICMRGNIITLVGHPTKIGEAESVLKGLYEEIRSGGKNMQQKTTDIIGAVATGLGDVKIRLKTENRTIMPRSKRQAEFVQLLQQKDLIFGLGPAGTGKTYMAVAVGVSMLVSGQVDRLILSRPAIEAGERLGFLPGDLKEKIDPYLRPIFDALHDMLSPQTLEKLMASNIIEVAPLAFMRGRTLSHAFIILDEAQNTTEMQMKMLLTRLGENARMVITGDGSQIDLPHPHNSGLTDAVHRLKDVPDIGFMRFEEEDVVRHRLVKSILKAYDRD
ncbi:MAG: PhoH family protein [Holosporaceae bacterium]|nr:MAG: PhoH family protein [Holosporaceae bacterium]